MQKDTILTSQYPTCMLERPKRCKAVPADKLFITSTKSEVHTLNFLEPDFMLQALCLAF